MNAVGILRAGIEAITGLFYPPHCAQCGVALESGQLCKTCAGAAKRVRAPFCHTCSESFDGALEDEFTCANCAGRTLYFDCAVTSYRCTGVVRDLVHRFKYRGEFYLRRTLASWLNESLEDARLSFTRFDGLVPVPLHPTRLREREFNQSEALAELVGKWRGLPVMNVLRRERYTTTQTQLDREERMENLHNAFALRQNASMTGLRLLLVDDVFTTGSTVNECARVLRRAGAASVCVVTVARG
jgi:ComF family protein